LVEGVIISPAATAKGVEIEVQWGLASILAVGGGEGGCAGGAPSYGIGGAGEGNRTLVVSLEGFCSTIELHPRAVLIL
jgi:hypothetical protein